MDGLFVHDDLYQGPTKSYVIGRFVIDVPTTLQLEVSTFMVKPIKSDESQTYSTNYLWIQEHPWRTDNHTEEMETYLAPYIKDAYLPDEMRHLHPVEDVTNLFRGNNAVRTVMHKFGRTHIHVVIQLTQGLLHIEEKRSLYSGELYDMEGPAAKLFGHYTWGKPQVSRGDVFYTAFGRVENYPSQEEDFSAVFENKMGYYLLFSTRAAPILIAGDRLFTTEEVHRLKKKYNATFERYREREVTQAGYTQMEYISKFDGPYGGYIVTFGYMPPVTPESTPQKPELQILFRSPWDMRTNAMPIWNSILRSLRPAQRPLE